MEVSASEIRKKWKDDPILTVNDLERKLENFRILFAYHSGKDVEMSPELFSKISEKILLISPEANASVVAFLHSLLVSRQNVLLTDLLVPDNTVSVLVFYRFFYCSSLDLRPDFQN